MDSISDFTTLLKNYFQLYYLKPFDAVNDAANAFSFQRFRWQAPVCEIGTGDGAFSFIMHGGELNLADDRYNQSNTTLPGDIYNTYSKSLAPSVTKSARRKYALGIDGNAVHLKKCEDFKLYDKLLQSPAESFSQVASESMQTVFFYVYHGLKDYEQALRESTRILKKGGELYLLAYSDQVREAFVCHQLSQQLSADQAGYFKNLDNGRRDELCAYSKSLGEWHQLFQRLNLEVEETLTQVSPLAWRFYDTQSRPFLKPLIQWDQQLREAKLKDQVKAPLIEGLLPALLEFSRLFAMPRVLTQTSQIPDVFLTFRLKKR